MEPYSRDEVFVGFDFLLFFPEVQIPHSQGFVIRGRIQILSSGMQGEPSDPVVVADKTMKELAAMSCEEADHPEIIAAPF